MYDQHEQDRNVFLRAFNAGKRIVHYEDMLALVQTLDDDEGYTFEPVSLAAHDFSARLRASAA